MIQVCNGDECSCIQYIFELNELNKKIKEENLNADEKVIFFRLSLNNPKNFLLIDQIRKKYLNELFESNYVFVKRAIFYEIEKIKTYLKCNKELEKLEDNLYILSKSFI